jgi:hypothetical protein
MARLERGMGGLPPDVLEKLIIRWMHEELRKLEMDD